MAPQKFSCSEELGRASDSPDPSTRIEQGNQNTSHFCVYKGSPTDGDNIDLVRGPQYQQDKEKLPNCKQNFIFSTGVLISP